MWGREDTRGTNQALTILDHFFCLGVSGSPPSAEQRVAGLTAALGIVKADPVLCTAKRTKVLLGLLVDEVGSEGQSEWTQVASLILQVWSLNPRH